MKKQRQPGPGDDGWIEDYLLACVPSEIPGWCNMRFEVHVAWVNCNFARSMFTSEPAACLAGSEVMHAVKSPACAELSDSCLPSECSSTKRAPGPAAGRLHLRLRRLGILSNESVMQGKVSCIGQLCGCFEKCSAICCIEM